MVYSILQFKYILKRHDTETIQKHMYMYKASNLNYLIIVTGFARLSVFQ